MPARPTTGSPVAGECAWGPCSPVAAGQLSATVRRLRAGSPAGICSVWTWDAGSGAGVDEAAAAARRSASRMLRRVSRWAASTEESSGADPTGTSLVRQQTSASATSS